MDRMIVGYDGSESAADALRWAVHEAELLGWPVHVLHSFRDPALALSPLGAMTSDSAAEERRLELDLDDLVAELTVAHPRVKITVETTDLAPFAAIDSAADVDDVIAVGARGRGGFGGLNLGSVSSRLAREARAPVVVVRQLPADAERGPVVVGVDGTPAGRRALRWASASANRHHAPLRAVMAWTYLLPEDDEGEAAFRPNYTEAQAREVLSRIVVRELGAPGDDASLETPCDLPASALLRRSAGARLLVVGARGSRRRGPFGLGSVSQQVLHHATCPVAVVRPPGS